VTTPKDPLAETHRVIVDGSNLLPGLARQGGPVPAAALIGRLRAAIPPGVGIELVFDGAPEPGLRGERIASGLTVRHAGRRSADEVIVGLVDHAGMTSGAAGTHALLVVTDDRQLGVAVRALGARTAGTGWLLRRLDRPRLASPSVGNRRPPTTPRAPGAGEGREGREGREDRQPWAPGRGATAKRGNPRRGRPSSGSMRS
jgi:hypothetical protein